MQQQSRRPFAFLSPMLLWRPGPLFGILPFRTSCQWREPATGGSGGPSGGAQSDIELDKQSWCLLGLLCAHCACLQGIV